MNKTRRKNVKLRAKRGKRIPAERKLVRREHPRLGMTDREQAKVVRQRLIGAIKPLTSEEIATGMSHKIIDIELAEDSVLTVSLRRKPDQAFIVGCYCAYCNARRADHWRRGENR